MTAANLLRTLAVAVMLALVVAACGDDDDGNADPSPTPDTTVSPENCAPNLGASLDGLDWFDVFPGQVYEEDVWRVLRGQGESPYVGVSRDMDIVGAIELEQSELGGDFLPADGIAALEAWASDYYGEAESDRTATYGEGYVFETSTPEAVNVGRFCAITFGFTGENDGTEVDRLAGFATFDPGNLYLFTAKYDASVAPDVGFGDVQSLADFEPVFGHFVPGLSLPPGSGATEVPTPEITPEGETPSS